MKLKQRYSISNIIFILILSLICIFYFIYFQNLIPAKFTFDSGSVMGGIVNPSSVDSSYRNVAALFKLLGINSNTTIDYIHLIAWLIFQLFLFVVLRINENRAFSFIQILFIIFFGAMYGVYFNALSKDLVLIFFLLIFLNLYLSNDNFNYLILFIGIYSLFFRGYWVVLLIFSIFIRIIKKPKIRKMMFYIIAFFILTIIIYNLFSGDFITNARENVNQGRIIRNDPNVKSMIQNILSNTNIVNDIVNYLYILITLFIPIQGLKSFNVIIYYFWIISLCYLIIKYRKYINIKLFLLLFAYINLQALFEPDLGSAFRHQLALFPLIYYLLNSTPLAS